jgi:hypothetical protein
VNEPININESQLRKGSHQFTGPGPRRFLGALVRTVQNDRAAAG